MSLRKKIEDRFSSAVGDLLHSSDVRITHLVDVASNPRFGDYQTNIAMVAAKVLGRNPNDVAAEIIERVVLNDLCDEPPTIAGPGFINMRLSGACVARELQTIARDPRLGVPIQLEQAVVVDYSSPNVAKEMHVGHLRSTIIGDSLVRILKFLGHRVHRQNHIGDWGTQFGMLIEHMLDQGWNVQASHTVADLNAMYQAAKLKFDSDDAFRTRARQRVVLLQAADAESLALWQLLIAESKRHFAEAYERLGVLLTEDDIVGESFYNPMLADVASSLQRDGVAVVSEGALCAFPPGFKKKDGNPLPLLIRKSDGGYGYDATDLAALYYRIHELNAQRIIYVVDARQRQHFAQLFAVAKMAGWLGNGVRAQHVAFGTILGDDGKPFKTRTGDAVTLATLLEEAVERARALIDQKDDPELGREERHQLAIAIGIGAVKYSDLASDRVNDYVFSWERMLSFNGNTAPYLQNAYVRVRSIFRRTESQDSELSADGTFIHINDPYERVLALQLVRFGEVVTSVGETLEPHRLCSYLYELASQFHQFYEHCSIIRAPDSEIRAARLNLASLVARTLATGLHLLGIRAVDRM